MKMLRSILVIYILTGYKEIKGSPAPLPKPDNDVHFHINLKSNVQSKTKQPLSESGTDYGITLSKTDTIVPHQPASNQFVQASSPIIVPDLSPIPPDMKPTIQTASNQLVQASHPIIPPDMKNQSITRTFLGARDVFSLIP